MGIAIIVPDVDFSGNNLGKVILYSNYSDILDMYPQMQEYIENEVVADDKNVTITSSEFVKTLKTGVSAANSALYVEVTLGDFERAYGPRNLMLLQGVSIPRVQSATFGINLTNDIELVEDARNRNLKFLLIYNNGTVSAYLDGVKIDDYTLGTDISGNITIGNEPSMAGAVINRFVFAKKA